MVNITLEELGRPLIYAVDAASTAGLAVPLARHGNSVRAWVRSLQGVQKEGITLSTRTGREWRFACDEGVHLGGLNQAPNPLGYVGVGIAASFMTELRVLAAMRNIALIDPVVSVESFYYRDGSFPKGTMVSGALSPEVRLTCASGADAVDMRGLLMDAIAASPLNGLIRDEKISRFAIFHNGVEIDPGEVTSLAPPRLTDPGDPIAAIRPATGYETHQPLATATESEESMIARLLENPQPAPVLPGSQKLLHLRTTCRLRPDGTYECLREQFAQVSQSWTCIVDDRMDAADAIAPDAASYFAVGVAFCFMTQIGRFSHIAKLPLDGYRVVQDLHLTRGGASGGGGEAGTGDPVETHVFIDSDLTDDDAGRVVLVAEKTCFLHALCRDRAKVRILNSVVRT